MDAYRITERIDGYVADAMAKHAAGLDIGWALSPPRLDPFEPELGWALRLILIVPVPDSDAYAQVTTSMAPLGPGPDDIDALIESMVAQLIESRDEQAVRLAALRN